MPRPAILQSIADILDAAPVAAGWKPARYTYRVLARQVYGVADPTPAQLSAVRRAVARLVGEGRAERARGDGLVERARGHEDSSSTHVRRRGATSYVCANPVGVEVRRPLTEQERKKRDELWAARKDSPWWRIGTHPGA